MSDGSERPKMYDEEDIQPLEHILIEGYGYDEREVYSNTFRENFRVLRDHLLEELDL